VAYATPELSVLAPGYGPLAGGTLQSIAGDGFEGLERVTIGAEGIAVDLRNDGIAAIVRDMITPLKEKALA